jgi:hypothetical protein
VIRLHAGSFKGQSVNESIAYLVEPDVALYVSAYFRCAIVIYKTRVGSNATVSPTMDSTIFIRRSLELSEDPTDEVECFGIAADLLQQMFSALQALAPNNAALARAIASRGPDALDRLSTLHKVVNLLTELDDRSIDLPLRRRATALISWLTGAIDELTLCTACDECLKGTLRTALQ